MGAGVALVALAPGFDAFKARRTLLLLTGAAFPVVVYIVVQPKFALWRGLIQRMLDVAMAMFLIVLVWTILPKQHRTGD